MKTVMHFLYSDIYSGAESVAVHIIKNLPNDYIGYYVAPKGVGIEIVKKLGVNTVECNTHSVKEIKKILKQYNPDIVHTHDPHMAFMMSLCTKRFVSHLHCNCRWFSKICPNSLALAWSFLKSKKVFCVSPSVNDTFLFKSLAAEKKEILYNFVDKEEVCKGAAEVLNKKYDVCFVGRLTDIKNPLRFISLISMIKEKIPDVQAVMVGDGDLKQQCIAEAEKSGLSNNITFAGYNINPYKYMANSKVGVLTSNYEGFGLVAVEAMILGVPFLAFSTGGLRDIINEENGKLCENINEMAEEAVKLISDENYRKTKSANAKNNSLKFTNKQNYMKRIIDAYNL